MSHRNRMNKSNCMEKKKKLKDLTVEMTRNRELCSSVDCHLKHFFFFSLLLGRKFQGKYSFAIVLSGQFRDSEKRCLEMSKVYVERYIAGMMEVGFPEALPSL